MSDSRFAFVEEALAELRADYVLRVELERQFHNAAILEQQVADLTAERDALSAFAAELLDGWPTDLGVDGFEMQDIAIKHGLLVSGDPVFAPCGESCQCAEYHGTDGMAEGVLCYRRSELLTGSARGKP
jgi:hypothetical protein